MATWLPTSACTSGPLASLNGVQVGVGKLGDHAAVKQGRLIVDLLPLLLGLLGRFGRLRLLELLLSLLQVVWAPIERPRVDSMTVQDATEAVRAVHPVVQLLVHPIGVEVLADMGDTEEVFELVRRLVGDEKQTRVDARIPCAHTTEHVRHLHTRGDPGAEEEHRVGMRGGVVEASRPPRVPLRHPGHDPAEVAHRVVPVLNFVRVGEPLPFLVEDAPSLMVVVQQVPVPHVREARGDHVGHIREGRRAGEVEGVAGPIVLDLVQEHADRAPVAQWEDGHAFQRA
mmetsp:Transcript_53479/g.159638  ORF Transcript_53479/g.159638 Transcript_53479/m.159638 type:complete len:285 (-) Transcript_53479:840-1694(-)